MAYKFVLILLVLGVAIFSGCVADKTVYFSKKYNETITLYADHTITVVGQQSSSSGTYRIDGNYLIITYLPFGNVDKLKIDGNRLIDEKDGDYWEKT